MPVTTAPTTLVTMLDQFREDARSNRALGDCFERLIVIYLQLDPIYADLFSDVWMFNDWPDKGRIGDVGIDIVARTRATGEYCAIQCKFYLPENTTAKGDIDSFVSAARKAPFTSTMIVTTTDNWGANARDALKRPTPPLIISVHGLEASPIDWSKFDGRRPQSLLCRTIERIFEFKNDFCNRRWAC